jgi:hypothetical protein
MCVVNRVAWFLENKLMGVEECEYYFGMAWRLWDLAFSSKLLRLCSGAAITRDILCIRCIFPVYGGLFQKSIFALTTLHDATISVLSLCLTDSDTSTNVF